MHVVIIYLTTTFASSFRLFYRITVAHSKDLSRKGSGGSVGSGSNVRYLKISRKFRKYSSKLYFICGPVKEGRNSNSSSPDASVSTARSLRVTVLKCNRCLLIMCTVSNGLIYWFVVWFSILCWMCRHTSGSSSLVYRISLFMLSVLTMFIDSCPQRNSQWQYEQIVKSEKTPLLFVWFVVVRCDAF